MSILILLSNKQLNVTLKFFFTPKKIESLVKNTMGDRFEESKSADLARDVLKEVANLTMGHVKNRFIASNLKVESSLPIAMRGYDNLFFREFETGENSQKNFWALQGDDYSIFCSLEASITGEIKDINFDELDKEDSEQAGGIDFL